MAKKITKRALQAQYKKYVMFDVRALMEVEELERMMRIILCKDVNVYRASNGELEIREDEFSLPMRVEDVLDSMEE